MLAAVQNYIPIVTSEAGLCLTAANWHAARVDTVSYSLEFLLYKPGLELLKKISNLSYYLGWHGMIILNASSLIANREGAYVLKSPYDGSKIKLAALELVLLIQHLNPDVVLLPQNILQDCPQIWNILHDTMMLFFNAEELQQQNVTRKHGVYLNLNYINDVSLAKWAHLPRYVMGVFNPELIHHLRAMGIQFIETDEPVHAAFHGRVYSQAGELDLMKASTKMQFEVIESQCACPVCSQQLTKAYLHHLLQHTPLLCQRFLIQHNVFWIVNRNN